MLFSFNWLKEYLEGLPPAKEAADALTMSGTEIESVTEKGAGITNVFTAQVLSCEKHPNADRLQYCQVKTDDRQYNIVCGARNMKPGDKVPLALAGAELPGGLKIKKSKIRGVESDGMMCSEVELGLKDTSEGLLILPEDAPLGKDITEYLDLKDTIMEAAVTPNRADLLSIKGLAREIAALTKAIYKDKKVKVEETGEAAEKLASVSIENGAPCGRYTARVITGVRIAPSPDKIKRRLEAHGVRAINNVVDVTNLVLLETGQPLHAFDLDKLAGRKINVRLARDGEPIETIDGKTRQLDPAMLVIADESRPVALAGVMGGKGSEVSDDTVNILLESAWFEPSSVRRTSRKTGLSTDSSYRFERGVDFEGVRTAIDMAASLIAALSGGKIARGVLESSPKAFEPRALRIKEGRIGEVLGVKISASEIKEIFNKLQIVIKESSEGFLTVCPPSFRMDLKEEADLVEEVARVYGFDRIPGSMPVAALEPGQRGRATDLKRRLKGALTGAGFTEAVNYSFISRGLFETEGPEGKRGVEILNPLSEDQSIMRDSLLPSLLDNLKRNLQKKNEEVRLFEIAPVFIPEGKLPKEEWRVAGALYGHRWRESWNYSREAVDFYDIKGVVEMLFEAAGLSDEVEVAPVEGVYASLLHPGKSAMVKLGGKSAGCFGEVHPGVAAKFDLKKPAYVFSIGLEELLEASAAARKKYRSIPKFPESARDIAFIIDESVPYKEIINSIKRLDTNLIERVELFDVYCGSNIPPGKRSLALRIIYRSRERTLTNEEVEAIHSRVSRELTERFRAEIRGERA